MQDQEYNDLKGPTSSKLENIQKANMHRNNCKIIEHKIRLIENKLIEDEPK